MLVTRYIKVNNAPEAGVWRIYWHGLPALDFVWAYSNNTHAIYIINNGFSGIIT
jgi:hypothetical protein